MFGEANNGAAFEFSTERMPEQDRHKVWCDVVARQGMRIESRPVPGQKLEVHIRGYAWPGLMLARANLSGMRDERTPELIGDGDDDVSFVINLTGPVTVTARGSDYYLAEGEGFAISSLEPSVFARPSPGSIVGLSIPRAALLNHVRHLDAALMRVIPARSEALLLLKEYLVFLLDLRSAMTAEVRQLVIAHVYQLVALALGPAPEVLAAMAGRGNVESRLIAIKADAMDNLGNRDLSIEWLALRHHVSVRYIQMLFESERATFSAFLLKRRLERADRVLGELASTGRSISAIAFDCGFGDLSYFNRAFRKRYGMTPSSRRAGVARES
jgi:AraC-like DNA-binding protein